MIQLDDVYVEEMGLVVPVMGMGEFTPITISLTAVGAVSTGYLLSKGLIPLAVGTGVFTGLVGAYGMWPSWGDLGGGIVDNVGKSVRSLVTQVGGAAKKGWALMRWMGDPAADLAVAQINSGVAKLETAQAMDRAMRHTGATHIERRAALAEVEAAGADEATMLKAELDTIASQMLHLSQAREQARVTGTEWQTQGSFMRAHARRIEIVDRLEELGSGLY